MFNFATTAVLSPGCKYGIVLQAENRKFCFSEPCKREPCRDKNHVTTNKCWQTKWGMFEDNYKCECAQGYDWETHTQECQSECQRDA